MYRPTRARQRRGRQPVLPHAPGNDYPEGGMCPARCPGPRAAEDRAMKMLIVPALLFALLVPNREVTPTPEAELSLLQGTWQVVALQDKGQAVDEGVAKAM